MADTTSTEVNKAAAWPAHTADLEDKDDEHSFIEDLDFSEEEEAINSADANPDGPLLGKFGLESLHVLAIGSPAHLKAAFGGPHDGFLVASLKSPLLPPQDPLTLRGPPGQGLACGGG